MDFNHFEKCQEMASNVPPQFKNPSNSVWGKEQDRTKFPSATIAEGKWKAYGKSNPLINNNINKTRNNSLKGHKWLENMQRNAKKKSARQFK